MSTLLESRPASRPSAMVEQLEDTRTGLRTYRVSAALAQLGLIELAIVAAFALADWLWITSAAVRAAGLLLMAAAVVEQAIRTFAGLHRLGRNESAVAVEETFPQLGQRVRTTLEYVEPSPSTAPAAAGLVDALVTDTDRQARTIDFQTLIPWRRLGWQAAALALVVVVAGVTFVVSSDMRIAVERLFFVPAYYTQLTVKPGDQQVKIGGDVVIQAELTGRPVRQVELRYRTVGTPEEPAETNDWQIVSLGTSDDVRDSSGRSGSAHAHIGRIGPGTVAIAGTVEKKLTDLEADLEYQIVAGQLASNVYRLTVIRPLALEQVTATITPPEYTRRPPVLESKGNVKVIEGSRVELTFTLDRPPQTAVLALRPTSPGAEAVQQPPVRIAGAELSVELASVDQELEYELTAEAADGMKLDARKFRIRVQPDQKPTIRFIEPPEQLEVTISTEVGLRVEAADDFGIGKLGIVYQVADEPAEELYLGDLPQQPLTFETLATLYLERHEVSFTDALTYYAFAEDNYPGSTLGSQEPHRSQGTHSSPGPHRATTELRFIDIRPYRRDYQSLQPGEQPGGT